MQRFLNLFGKKSEKPKTTSKDTAKLKELEKKAVVQIEHARPTIPTKIAPATPAVPRKLEPIITLEYQKVRKKISFNPHLESKVDASILNYFKSVEEFKNSYVNSKQEFRYKNHINLWMSEAPKTPEEVYLLAVAINFESDTLGKDATARAINKDPLPIPDSFSDDDLFLNKYYGNVITVNLINPVLFVMNLLNDAGCRGHLGAQKWMDTLLHCEAKTESHIKAQKWLAALQEARKLSLAQGSLTLLSPSELKAAAIAMKNQTVTEITTHCDKNHRPS